MGRWLAQLCPAGSRRIEELLVGRTALGRQVDSALQAGEGQSGVGVCISQGGKGKSQLRSMKL